MTDENVKDIEATENENAKSEDEGLTIEQQVQKLTEQNQSLMNDLAKLKKASDKNSAEASEWKKKYQATLSAQEQASQEKAEKEAAREEQFKQLMRENQVNKFVRQYMSQGYTEELAQKAAEAMYDGDTETFFKVQSDATNAIIKAREAEWLKSRPDVNAGTGNSVQITKEQFSNMDIVERSKLKREHPDVYDRLVGRK